MSYTQAGGDGADWESSFSQILNRTKHNLNRINSRYAPGAAPSVLDTSVLAARGVINNENVHQNSLLLDRFSKTDTFLQRPAEAPRANVGGSSTTVDTGILERLVRLEEHSRAVEITNNSRLAGIESNVAAAVSNTDRTAQHLKDLESKIMQLNGKLSTINGFVELLQGENETKRSTIAKMDHWIRQGEIWREELDGKVETLTNLTRSLDRTRTEQRELMSEHATRYELEQLRDKVTVITQQSVAASLSAWHDKIEQSVRNVERQVALVRIGMTDAGRGTAGGDALLTPDEVAAALANPLPSELLLKGTVAHEVMQMQAAMEEKLESRMQLFLKDKVDVSHTALHKELHEQLHNLCAEMGLDYPEVELGAQQYAGPEGVDMTGARARENYRIRLLEARKRSDEEVQELSRSLHRVSTELATLQQNTAVDQRHQAGVVGNLERKVEECITVCGTSVQTVAERSSRLENLVRDSELSIRESVTAARSEWLERLADVSGEWSTERAGLDRRLVVNERIAEDCLDRIKLSQSAVESYFKASPDIKRFQRTSEVVAQLQQQVTGVQEEVRTTSASVHKLEANASTKNEHLELRERVARMEPTVLERLPDYMTSTKRVVDLSVALQSRVDKLDALTSLQHNDLAATITRVSAVDVLATQLKGLTTVATEEVRRLSASVAEIDTTTRKDVNYLRDLTGSISSRVVAVEGKVSVMNKTYAADTVTTNNALAKLSTIVEDLHAHDITTQNTLVQLQWAVEAEHRENSDQFALLKGRLDLMHQVQHHGAGAPVDAAGKSIEIRFKTAADSSGEAEESESDRSSAYTASQVPPPTSAGAPAKASSAPSIVPPAAAAGRYAVPPWQAAPAGAPQSEAGKMAVPALQSLPEVPPPTAKSSTRGASAFMTEPSMSSPEKSGLSSAASRTDWSPPPAPAPAPMTYPTETADMSRSRSFPEQATPAAAPLTPQKGAFVPAHEYSYDAASPRTPGVSLEQTQSVHSKAPGASPMETSELRARESTPGTEKGNMSTSQIPMHSAFDMSMPDYVSQIDSSGDAQQASFDYSYRQASGQAASDAGSRASSKLSVGSEDSVDQLNDTVASLVKHRDSVLGGEQSPTGPRTGSQAAAPVVTYDAQAAAAAKEESSSDEESAEGSEERADSAEEDDAEEGSAESGDDQSDQSDGTEDDEEEEEEEEDEGTLNTHSQSETTGTSAGGSYSQIDGPGAARTGVPALSMVDNSWDKSNAQTSFTTAVTGSTPSKDVSASGSSLSGASHSSGAASGGAAKKMAGFAIPTLNMTSLPARTSDAEDIPSYRSTGRDLSQYLPGNSSRAGTSSRLGMSDWDADASQSQATGSPLAPQSGQKASTAPAPTSPAAVRVAASAPEAAAMAPAATPSPRAADPSDESTVGGSVSDTSVSSGSNLTASSSSYLTLSSASPVKATVPAVAAARVPAPAPAPVPARAPATTTAKLDLSTLSKAEQIKERLKNRLNKNKTSDAASVSSGGPVDEVVSFEDLEDSKH